ncbi:MAG: SRPBCC domain-containing protein [Chitinophagaceae bacterium]
MPAQSALAVAFCTHCYIGKAGGVWQGLWGRFSSLKRTIMITRFRPSVEKNIQAKTIKVVKKISAPVDKVWNAWTKAEQLDKWWGPKPWRAVTKSMDFKEGGSWLYKMAGPNGEAQWDKVVFEQINAPNSFSATDLFVDENGNKSGDMPKTHWQNKFVSSTGGTTIECTLSFDSKEDMQKILDTGFEEGFSIGLEQLEDLIADE